MNTLVRICGILLLVGFLVSIRAFEAQLFYDPLLHFFKANHTTAALPEMNLAQLYLGLTFRFVLNTTISLMILWLIFRNSAQVKFSMVLYGLFFISCLSLFSIFLFANPEGPHQPLFYARRFLIQPLLLFLLVPAFYFFGKVPSIKK